MLATSYTPSAYPLSASGKPLSSPHDPAPLQPLRHPQVDWNIPTACAFHHLVNISANSAQSTLKSTFDAYQRLTALEIGSWKSAGLALLLFLSVCTTLQC